MKKQVSYSEGLSYHSRPEMPSFLPPRSQHGCDDSVLSYPSFYSSSVESVAPTLPRENPATKNAPVPASMEVSIAPGVSAPLRGAQETTEAVRQDFIMNLICWGCQKEIYCIADCRWALCPGCRTISPLVDGNLKGNEWGLGLGITPEALQSMRYEEFSRSSFF